MDANKVGLKNKRHVWVAVVFSLILPGMGQIYCGRLVRGLVFSFLNMFPVPLIMGLLSFPNCPILVELVFAMIFAGGLVQLIAIIDSALIAKKIKDYPLKEYNRPIVYILLLLLVVGSNVGDSFYFRDKLLQPFRIPNASNYPTLVPGDRFLANKLASDSKRGDLVVFLDPGNRRVNYIKRVVAVAGDTVEIKDNQLYINDQQLERQKLPQSVLDNIKIEIDGKPLQGDVFYEINGDAEYKIFIDKSSNEQASSNFAKITVPAYHCFVLGDNRNNTRDSRDFGPVLLATIKGRADYLYCPAKDWSRFGRIK